MVTRQSEQERLERRAAKLRAEIEVLEATYRHVEGELQTLYYRSRLLTAYPRDLILSEVENWSYKQCFEKDAELRKRYNSPVPMPDKMPAWVS